MVTDIDMLLDAAMLMLLMNSYLGHYQSPMNCNEDACTMHGVPPASSLCNIGCVSQTMFDMLSV